MSLITTDVNNMFIDLESIKLQNEELSMDIKKYKNVDGTKLFQIQQ